MLDKRAYQEFPTYPQAKRSDNQPVDNFFFARCRTGDHVAGMAQALAPIFVAPGILPAAASRLTQVGVKPSRCAARAVLSNSVCSVSISELSYGCHIGIIPQGDEAMTAENEVCETWLKGFFALTMPERAGVIDYITQSPSDIGADLAARLRELYDLPPDSPAVLMADDVQRLADEFGAA